MINLRFGARKLIPRIDPTKALLRIESFLTIPFFVTSWLVCAIGFAVRAGFLMAKADGADKSAILNQILKRKP
jgi:hypothetical protein